MNITIINGIPDEGYTEYENELNKVVGKLAGANTVNCFTIRRMDISYCCGCFSCWVKSPSICVFKDDMELILESVAKSDIVIYVSPLTAGFVTSYTKKVMDRLIPCLLPYIRIINGESHHLKRYNKEARLGVVVIEDEASDSQAKEITWEIFRRFSLNMPASSFAKAAVTSERMEGAINEISNC